MNVIDEDHVELLRLAACKLTGHKQRIFVAEVAIRLCAGSARQAEERFGWGHGSEGDTFRQLGLAPAVEATWLPSGASLSAVGMLSLGKSSSSFMTFASIETAVNRSLRMGYSLQ
jgi:hypothetical protein